MLEAETTGRGAASEARTALVMHHEKRRAERETVLGGKPDKIDVTVGRVGDRIGFFVSGGTFDGLDTGLGLEIVVRSPHVSGEVMFRALGGITHLVSADGCLYPEEVGMSRDKVRGGEFTASPTGSPPAPPQLRPRQVGAWIDDPPAGIGSPEELAVSQEQIIAESGWSEEKKARWRELCQSG